MSSARPTSAWELLITPPTPFNSIINQQATEAQSGPTSSQEWATSVLVNFRLAEMPWDWAGDEDMPHFEEVMARANVSKSKSYIPGMLISTPRNEADIKSACEVQVTIPVLNIAESWEKELCLLDSCRFTKGLPIELELISEEAPERVRTQTQIFDHPHFNKIFIFSDCLPAAMPSVNMLHETWTTFQNEVSHMDTVNMSIDGLPTPFAANAYLKVSQFFNIGSQEAQEAASAEGKSLLKGLVAMQHEIAGSINASDVQTIANGQISLGEDGHFGSVAITMASLQRAIRHGYHYGVDYVYITDYLNVIALRLPRHATAGNASSENIYDVQWALVEREEARLLLAFLLWKSMKDLKKLLSKADEVFAPATV